MSYGTTHPLATAAAAAAHEPSHRGSTAVTLLGLYYIAPLTSLFKVLADRDSSSIYWPLSLANLANALLWMVYGMVSGPEACS